MVMKAAHRDHQCKVFRATGAHLMAMMRPSSASSSRNLRRRHLDTSQRAMIAAELANVYARTCAGRRRRRSADVRSHRRPSPRLRPLPRARPAVSLRPAADEGRSGEMTLFASSSPRSAGRLPRDYTAPSAFEPDALIREARRQKRIPVADVPRICVLDPDGDIVRHLSSAGRTRPVPQWPCYHSRMIAADLDGRSIGIVAPYAVLVAEQMVALGCELLLSITSSRQVAPLGPTPYFVLIDRALRDEGTSHHYAPPAEFAEADATVVPTAEHALAAAGIQIHRGATWTTDAPFRETSATIAVARTKGILTVEIEAAALPGASACCARPRHQLHGCMRQSAHDFEKGET